MTILRPLWCFGGAAVWQQASPLLRNRACFSAPVYCISHTKETYKYSVIKKRVLYLSHIEETCEHTHTESTYCVLVKYKIYDTNSNLINILSLATISVNSYLTHTINLHDKYPHTHQKQFPLLFTH